jgi:hypothetical protein
VHGRICGLSSNLCEENGLKAAWGRTTFRILVTFAMAAVAWSHHATSNAVEVDTSQRMVAVAVTSAEAAYTHFETAKTDYTHFETAKADYTHFEVVPKRPAA